MNVYVKSSGRKIILIAKKSNNKAMIKFKTKYPETDPWDFEEYWSPAEMKIARRLVAEERAKY